MMLLQANCHLKNLILSALPYNKGECRIDYSDQMVSCAMTIKKGIKWYRKLGNQIYLGITVVNTAL